MPITDETRKKIFDKLKKHLEKCCPPMVRNSMPSMGEYELIGNIPVPYGYDKKMVPGMFFASIANRKDSVAFYFFPCYYEAAMKDVAPTLSKYLKGKTCFHFKKEMDLNEKELASLLKAGVDAWKKAGYLM
jgi:hypothetical protein